MFTSQVKEAIDAAVLCWLATSDKDMPNVSPKEMFTYCGDDTLLIAEIASPQSLANILQNPHVCVSFIDIFVQKGFKLKGTAFVHTQKNSHWDKIYALFGDAFPIRHIIEIKVTAVEPIVAPSYWLYPDISHESQIASAKRTYKVH